MGYYEPDCKKEIKHKYICKDHDPCQEDEYEKCECEDPCKGVTRWGASFMTPPTPPFIY